MHTPLDIAVLGAGPAGLAAAAACAEQGLGVACVDPAPDAPWRNGYGAWVDELELVGAAHATRATWSRALVHTGSTEHVLARPYARIDNTALQGWLRTRAEGAGAVLERGAAVRVVHHDAGSVVQLEGGGRLHARLVIDATGHASRFVTRGGEPRAYQVAWGVLAEVDGHPWGDDEMVLMDWRPLAGADPTASFLYAMPLPDGRVFLEETSLAADPPVGLTVLRSRLHRRLEGLGIRVRRIHEVERCRIPMDAPLPPMPQRVVGFGGAASMVHPATGYLVARALRSAPGLAAALVEGLDGGSLDGAAAHAWRAIWSPGARRTRALHQFGLQVLLALEPDAVRAFFDRFFTLPGHHWQRYLAATSDPLDVAAAMTALFGRLDPSLRWRVTRLATAQPGRRALRTFVSQLGGSP